VLWQWQWQLVAVVIRWQLWQLWQWQLWQLGGSEVVVGVSGWLSVIDCFTLLRCTCGMCHCHTATLSPQSALQTAEIYTATRRDRHHPDRRNSGFLTIPNTATQPLPLVHYTSTSIFSLPLPLPLYATLPQPQYPQPHDTTSTILTAVTQAFQRHPPPPPIHCHLAITQPHDNCHCHCHCHSMPLYHSRNTHSHTTQLAPF
jgi:hypothetical protein